jgi:hypothetical protein
MGLAFFKSEYDESVIEIYRKYLQQEAPVFRKAKNETTGWIQR